MQQIFSGVENVQWSINTTSFETLHAQTYRVSSSPGPDSDLGRGSRPRTGAGRQRELPSRPKKRTGVKGGQTVRFMKNKGGGRGS